MTLSEDAVREELKKVIDPELFVNIVDLGLIYVVDLKPSGDHADPTEAVESSGTANPMEDAEATKDAPMDASGSTDKTDVVIEMTMTSPACPAGPQLVANSKSVVTQMDGVGQVEVKIVMDPPWTPDRMTEDARDQLGIF